MERVSSALVLPGALRDSRRVARYRECFEKTLGTPCVAYEWAWIAQGTVLYYDTADRPVLADQDYVEIAAKTDVAQFILDPEYEDSLKEPSES